MSEVRISYTIGNVSIKRGDTKRNIEAIPFKKSIPLKDRDNIATGPRSYVIDLSDKPGYTQTGTMITVFPNSKFALGIKGNLITTVELVNGLFRIATEKGVITPTAELRFPQGTNTFWIYVAKDGAVVVASEAVPMEVVHKKTIKGAVIGFQQQVTVTEEDILEPCAVDQRFKEAHKLIETLEQSKAKFLYGDMLEKKVPQEIEKFTTVIEEKTGRKEHHNFARYQKWLEEQKEFGEWKYEEAVKSELPEFKVVKAEEKIVPAVEPKLTEIDKTINYQGIAFKIVSAEKVQEYKGRKAPENKNFLVLNVEAMNNSYKQAFVFYYV